MTLREQYERDGYVVVQTGLPTATLDAAREADGPLQPAGYHWSDGPRVFEAWKTSQAVRDICHAPAVLAAIEELTGERALPFQTISFRKGTNQALHQDAVHFQTLPLGRIVGAWVALEDMDEDNGPLCVVPGSHARGFVSWNGWGHASFGLPRCKVGEQFEDYSTYEESIASLAKTDGPSVPLVCPAGSVVLWHLNLLHGGTPIRDQSRTRYSLATHYFLESAVAGWAPMFSDPDSYDFHFKRMRWFDQAGNRREWHEREAVPEVTLW